MKRIYYVLATASLLLAGCSQDDTSFSTPESKAISFSQAIVTADKPVTRLYMDEPGQLAWDDDDAIGIFSDQSAQPVQFTYESGNTFVSPIEVSGSTFYAFYPYSADAVDADDNSLLHFTLSNVLDPTGNTLPMVAVSDNNQFRFIQTLGLLHFTLEDAEKVKSVTLKGNNGEILAGAGTVNLSPTQAPVFVLDETEATESNTSVTITIPDSMVGSAGEPKDMNGDGMIDEYDAVSSAIDIYFVVPVGVYEKGFTVTVNSEDGVITKVNNDRVEVSRASMDNYDEFSVANDIRATELALEREALIAFYKALDGDNWKTNYGWCSDDPVGSWYGVRTNQEGYVYELWLYENGLKGDVPAEFGNLKHLTYIALSDKDVTSLPAEIGNMDAVNRIMIFASNITSLPDEIGNMKSLKSISVGNTPLESIPAGIGNSQTLTSLSLSGTQVSELPAIPSLTYLSLVNNKFKTFPSALTDCVNLTSLTISEPNMTGRIPSAISNLSDLSFLSITGTKISGTLDYLTGLSNLETLYLNNNQFTGNISARFAQLANLKTMDLSGNKMLGYVPDGVVGSNMWKNLQTVKVNPQQEGFGLSFLNEIAATQITLAADEFFVARGQRTDMGAKIIPENATNKAFTAESEDNEIAVIDIINGSPYIYGRNPGKTTVTVRAADNEEVYAFAEVTVKGIIFAEPEIIIERGETVKPEFTQFGDDEIEWGTDSDYVAVIDEDGNITAKNSGTTSIYAHVGDNWYYLKVTVPGAEVNGGNTQDFTGQNGEWDN